MHVNWFEDEFYAKKKIPAENKIYEIQEQVQFNKSIKRLLIKFIMLLSMIGILMGMMVHFKYLNKGLNNESLSDLLALNYDSSLSSSGESESQSVITATAKVTPSVISVLSYNNLDLQNRELLGIGSGVIYKISQNKVYIITNCHVVDQGQSYQIVTYDGEKYEAKLIGKDLITDIAVIEVISNKLKKIGNLGDSNKLKIGETVIALGNSLGLGHSPTVTKGIISSLNRSIPVSIFNNGTYDWEMEVIQTDAAINQGNSGGPLINLKGDVIGINSLKISDTGVEGLGFSIPINNIKPIIKQLVANGRVSRVMMGVMIQDLQEISNADKFQLPKNIETGVVLTEVYGPSLEAGLQINDVIIRLDNEDIHNGIDLRKYLFTHKHNGDKLLVVFYRNGVKTKVELELIER